MRTFLTAFIMSGVLCLVGCGPSRLYNTEAGELYRAAQTYGAEQPKDEDEQIALNVGASLAAGQVKKANGREVAVVRQYFAASGRACKMLSLHPKVANQAIQYRLICQQDNTWFYAPEVSAGPLVKDSSP